MRIVTWKIVVLVLGCFNILSAQFSVNKFLTHSDSFNKKRVLLSSAFAAAAYGTLSIGLYTAWYKNVNQSRFHFFNDHGEWSHMDKFGHVYDGYYQSDLIYQGARWSGLSENKSILWGIGISTLFQSTIEVMDGHSEKWGFSWPDIASNLLGNGLFVLQQKVWHEQKIYMKFLAYPVSYPSIIITGDKGTKMNIQERAKELYGNSFGSKLLKDYNSQSYWLSFNPGLFSSSIKKYWPEYVNIAIGYGAQDMLGGFDNTWLYKGEYFDATAVQRHQQYFLSFDLDLRKIPVQNKFLKTAFRILNIFKFPAPTVEYNSLGKWKWYWLG